METQNMNILSLKEGAKQYFAPLTARKDGQLGSVAQLDRATDF